MQQNMSFGYKVIQGFFLDFFHFFLMNFDEDE